VEDKLKTSQIGAELAEKAGSDTVDATEAFKRLVRTGAVPPDGETWGRGGKAWLFPRSTPAIAAVMLWLFQNAGIRDRSDLRGIWNFFAVPHHDGGEPAITHIMAEIAAGRTAWLICTRWGDRQTGDSRFGVSLRFEEERDRPLEPPIPGFEPIADLVLDLGHLLSRFVFEPPAKSQVN
jgi:hypothetical protein